MHPNTVVARTVVSQLRSKLSESPQIYVATMLFHNVATAKLRRRGNVATTSCVWGGGGRACVCVFSIQFNIFIADSTVHHVQMSI